MPLSDASLPLQKAIVAALKADAAVSALIGTRIYDAVPMNAAKPYVSFGPFQLLAEQGDCLDGGEIIVQLDAWANGPDSVEVKRLGAALAFALDGAPLALDDNQRLVMLEIQDTQYLREPDGLTAHGVISVRALTEPIRMSKELQEWMRAADYRMKRELAGKVKEQAERLADAIRAAAPVRTGKLRDSVRVHRTRKELRFVVTAKATREYARTARYEREVAVGSGDTQGIARGTAAGVTYDYAVAVEFGNERAPAQPFFYSTARALEAEIHAELERAVGELINR